MTQMVAIIAMANIDNNTSLHVGKICNGGHFDFMQIATLLYLYICLIMNIGLFFLDFSKSIAAMGSNGL